MPVYPNQECRVVLEGDEENIVRPPHEPVSGYLVGEVKVMNAPLG